MTGPCCPLVDGAARGSLAGLGGLRGGLFTAIRLGCACVSCCACCACANKSRFCCSCNVYERGAPRPGDCDLVPERLNAANAACARSGFAGGEQAGTARSSVTGSGVNSVAGAGHSRDTSSSSFAVSGMRPNVSGGRSRHANGWDATGGGQSRNACSSVAGSGVRASTVPPTSPEARAQRMLHVGSSATAGGK